MLTRLKVRIALATVTLMFVGAMWMNAPHNVAAQGNTPAPVRTIDPANFVNKIDNPYFSLKPGTTFIFEGVKDGDVQHDEVYVSHETKVILGVTCIVVKHKSTLKAKQVEDTLDWYAQDKDGNVWYFGEDTKAFGQGNTTSTKGSWQGGVDGAKPGIIMEAKPKVGDSYLQEYYKGKAEDMAMVFSLNEAASVPVGSFDNLLMIKEWTPLDPGTQEYKYYAAGVGEVMVLADGEELKLVKITTE